MYLFILETIGTQELILVGMVALIVFGPRKLPQMAKKAGAFIREMRSVSNDFRSTWEQEVSLEEGSGDSKPAEMENSLLPENTVENQPDKSDSTSDSDPTILPEVREVSEEEFKKLTESKIGEPKTSEINPPENGKQDWL